MGTLRFYLARPFFPAVAAGFIGEGRKRVVFLIFVFLFSIVVLNPISVSCVLVDHVSRKGIKVTH